MCFSQIFHKHTHTQNTAAFRKAVLYFALKSVLAVKMMTLLCKRRKIKAKQIHILTQDGMKKLT